MKIYWKRNKLFLAVTLFFGTAAAISTAFVSVVLQKVMDAALGGGSESFGRTVLFTVVYILVLCALSYLASLSAKYLLLRISKQMREDIFSGIMRHNPARFWRVNTADYLSALTNDMKSVEENYILTFLMTVEMGALFLTTLLLLLFLSPLVTGILVVNMLLMFLLPLLFGKLLEKRQSEISAQLSVYTEKLKDIFSGFEVIRSFGMTSRMKAQFCRENDRTVKTRLKADRLFALNEGISDTLSTLSVVTVIVVSAWLVMRGSITTGTLLALTQLSGTFLTPIVMIMQNIPKLQGMKPVISRLGEIAQYEEEDWKGEKLPHFKESIRLKDLTFSYDESRKVVDRVNWTFEKGKKYAILGESGCGKSTLVKLITGYFSNYQGGIYYDGEELRDLKVKELSGILAMIHQNVYLFNATVKENITLFEEFEEDRIQRAMERSGVVKFLDQLENGLATLTGENGSHLSGGQRQRIALARAFLRDIDLVILDEGTSAVDRETAMEIENGLLSQENLTLITITHNRDPRLLAQYDQVISLRKGQIRA